MCWGRGDDARVVDDCQARVALGEEGCQPHVALVVGYFHCLLVLDGLDVLVSLEGELVYLDKALVYLDEELVNLDEELVDLDEGLDDAHVLGKSFL